MQTISQFSKFAGKMLDFSPAPCYNNKAGYGEYKPKPCDAGVAQLVEQLICNQQVGGSSPSTSFKIWESSRVAKGGRL